MQNFFLMVFLLRDAIVSSAVQPLLPSLTPHQCMSEHTLQRSGSFPWICWDSCKSLLDREWRVAAAYKLSYPSLTEPSQIPVALSPVGFFRFHSILAQFLGQRWAIYSYEWGKQQCHSPEDPPQCLLPPHAFRGFLLPPSLQCLSLTPPKHLY